MLYRQNLTHQSFRAAGLGEQKTRSSPILLSIATQHLNHSQPQCAEMMIFALPSTAADEYRLIFCLSHNHLTTVHRVLKRW